MADCPWPSWGLPSWCWLICCLYDLLRYPLVMTKIATENGHVSWVFPWNMVIVHSYVKLPEGMFTKFHSNIYVYVFPLKRPSLDGDFYFTMLIDPGGYLLTFHGTRWSLHYHSTRTAKMIPMEKLLVRTAGFIPNPRQTGYLQEQVCNGYII